MISQPTKNFSDDKLSQLYSDYFGLDLLKSLSFPITNEFLLQILEGLEVKKEDLILSICGSGDQAFAMAAQGAEVTAVDVTENQLDYARKRIQALYPHLSLNGFSFEAFGVFNIDIINRKGLLKRLKPLRDDFFRELNLCCCLEDLSRINFISGSIFDLDPSHYNKLYLSNAINYSIIRQIGSPKIIEGFIDKISTGTLIYNAGVHGNKFLSSTKSLLEREDLTQKAVQARPLDWGWNVQIYEKQ